MITEKSGFNTYFVVKKIENYKIMYKEGNVRIFLRFFLDNIFFRKSKSDCTKTTSSACF